ncbi:hydroxyacid dehydrogenase [Tepidanaerobacter sp. GT38]|uniref:hydroxyacid dehydrogenase n=1 Tax=Tepidanaerobacter sp. GT38 TaxID=2722793 RepID=UPI001F3E74DB|nr:hydroxyacid dehydrogenase [Tepidanaerobacter sp. GT38]MCG1013090.1 hydroxyacid dehydrogenase [Tepidanaerobacter sp. GT38]
MKKILITSPIHAYGTNMLKEKFEVIIAPDENKETIIKLVEDADAMIVRLAEIDKDIISNGKKLKIIAKHGAGVDNIDVKYATKRGIYVVNTGNANSLSVAEHTIAGILAVFKRINIVDNAVRAGNWFIKNDNKSMDFTGKTLGLIGLGSIGSEVARMAKYGFRMNILAYDPYVDKNRVAEKGIKIKDSLEEIFKVADIISVHTPLTEETKGLISRKLLSLLKPTAIFVNFARGEIVDEEALLELLKEGRIFGAALDVFCQEPLPDNSPFLELDNVILSPHGASFTEECRLRMSKYLAQDIIAFFEGKKPERIVNRELIH